MYLHRFDQVQDFWQATQAYLCQSLAEHNLLLGVLLQRLRQPKQTPIYLAAVFDQDVDHECSQSFDQASVVAVAIQTPPHKLLLSKAADLDAVALIAADVQSFPSQLPGVSALVPESTAFVTAWQAMTGQASRRVMEMCIHRLTAVQPLTMPEGELRLATPTDRSLLVNWFRVFASEIGEVVRADPEEFVDGGIQRGSIYLWVDAAGNPVSWAGGSQVLPSFARVGPVYTPPEFRRRGYASACVAQMSQRFLAQSCQACFLFTDLANPTSNHIYRSIGYQPLCDWHDYGFGAGA
jgi:uncharacterized protein